VTQGSCRQRIPWDKGIMGQGIRIGKKDASGNFPQRAFQALGVLNREHVYGMVGGNDLFE